MIKTPLRTALPDGRRGRAHAQTKPKNAVHNIHTCVSISPRLMAPLFLEEMAGGGILKGGVVSSFSPVMGGDCSRGGWYYLRA